ncbi:MAG: TrkA family potassium uptake protein [Dehalococcoides mccartyi]|uniref:Trk system potassium uptake protein TrkA n=1 Tax=Dehalococcoides mccartyi TaxID=61435 RepID=A0A0V8LXS1_9CHLR|nr:TrkA family potassium uptake protein [Dehalococcoides mccartyi]KSV16293.1 portal protein [Dehalococcoides mccartyi]
MYVVVIGGGRLGYYLLKALLNDGHEVLLIEKNSALCDGINKEMGSVCLHGDGCETAVLTEAGTSRADLLIAVTGDDEDNLVACQVAKYKFNVPRTIARVRNPKNESVFKKLGVDSTVNSTNIILEHIEHEVPSHAMTHLLTLHGKDLEIIDIRIPDNALTVGKQIHELVLPSQTIISLIIRKDSKPVLPRPETTVQAGDQFMIVAAASKETEIRDILTAAA